MEAFETEPYPPAYLETLMKQILEHGDYVGRDENGQILAGARLRPAADHGGGRSRVMRAAKRAAFGKLAILQHAGDALHHADLENFRN